MEEAASIRVSGLTKSFAGARGEVNALQDVSLEVAPGKFFVVVGPSGCGKTTLLRILAGLEKPSAGSVEIVGPKGADQPTTSIVFQEESIFPWMNVWDNAAYGLRMRGVPKRDIKRIVGAYLNMAGLAGFEHAYPHQLSGGMKQRVSLVRAFANNPEVLLMDEPFSALDEQNKALLQQELLKIWGETRKTVVFITHSVDEAIVLGDQIMVMSSRPGRVKALVQVPFDRPRDVLDLRAEPEYGGLVRGIWEQLRTEVEQQPALAGGFADGA